MPEVIREIDITVAPSKVWRWFTTQEGLRRWLLPDLEIDPTIGGEFRAVGPDGTPISGVVLDIVDEGRLVLSWFEEGTGWVHPARLKLALRPVSAGTRVSLVHDGFAGIGTPTWRRTERAYETAADRHGVLDALVAVVDADA